MLAIGLTACASSVPSTAPSPTVAPTPVITPDPHLTEPATADAVFGAIRLAGLPLSVTNAIGGDPNSPIVKQINAAVDNWPLVITQYKDGKTLRTAAKWDPAKPPGSGNPPYAFVGLNIMISFGPTAGVAAPPDANRQAEAQRIIDVIDPLLWPLEQRTVRPVPTRTSVPSTAPASSKPAKATPKPSPKP
jgi:hypothetical protein